MKTKSHFLNLAVLAGVALLAATAARAADFHVATAQDLQNALTAAEGNGANNNIWLTNGYYTGNFSYSSSATYSLTVWPEPNLTNVAIDGAGRGAGTYNIACSRRFGQCDREQHHFRAQLRQLPDWRAAYRGQQRRDDHRERLPVPLADTNSLGMGLEIASGLNTIIRNCTVLGKTNGMRRTETASTSPG